MEDKLYESNECTLSDNKYRYVISMDSEGKSICYEESTDSKWNKVETFWLPTNKQDCIQLLERALQMAKECD